MKATVIGCDPSSVKLAFAVTSPRGEYFLSVKLDKSLDKDKVKECAHAYKIVSEILRIYSGAFVFLEKPVGAVGGYRATIPQAQVGGAIMAACKDVPCMLVSNSAWKLAVFHFGNPSKALIASRMRTRWPSAYEAAKTKRGAIDQDIIDASAINLYGRIVLRRASADKEKTAKL